MMKLFDNIMFMIIGYLLPVCDTVFMPRNLHLHENYANDINVHFEVYKSFGCIHYKRIYDTRKECSYLKIGRYAYSINSEYNI